MHKINLTYQWTCCRWLHSHLHSVHSCSGHHRPGWLEYRTFPHHRDYSQTPSDCCKALQYTANRLNSWIYIYMVVNIVRKTNCQLRVVETILLAMVTCRHFGAVGHLFWSTKMAETKVIMSFLNINSTALCTSVVQKSETIPTELQLIERHQLCGRDGQLQLIMNALSHKSMHWLC